MNRQLKPLLVYLFFYGSIAQAAQSVSISIQWGTLNPLDEGLRSFQPETKFYQKTGIPLTQTFDLTTDRTHNRIDKACRRIVQPWTQAKKLDDRDYLKGKSYVRAVRISQTPQTAPGDQNMPPFTHPYPRSVRGIAFYINGNCGGRPNFVIWPKLGMDMDYDSVWRYNLREDGKPDGEIENFYYKWWQTFEFSDFDVRKDPYGEVREPVPSEDRKSLRSGYQQGVQQGDREARKEPMERMISHYNSAITRPMSYWTKEVLEDVGKGKDNPEATRVEDIERMKKEEEETYWIRPYLQGTLNSPIGSPYRQQFGSFREIFPTRADDNVWKGIVEPSAGDTSYWDIPMINVQLDHRDGGGIQKRNAFDSFVPYGLLDSAKAKVFDAIEEEYDRFYKLMAKLLGTSGNSWWEMLRWTTARQNKALSLLEWFSDPKVPNSKEIRAHDPQFQAFPGQWKDLRDGQLLPTSPDEPDAKEWVIPPSWLEVPKWKPTPGSIDPKVFGSYLLETNPNRYIYSSVTIQKHENGGFTATSLPVISNPELGVQKETVALLEQLPVAEYTSSGGNGRGPEVNDPKRTRIVVDYSRPEETFQGRNNYYKGSIGGQNLDLDQFLRQDASAGLAPVQPGLRLPKNEVIGRISKSGAELPMDSEGDLTISNIRGGRERYSPVSSPARSRAGSQEDIQAGNPRANQGFSQDRNLLTKPPQNANAEFLDTDINDIISRPRSRPISRHGPLAVERLDEGAVEYRPPRSLIESTSSLLRSANTGRKLLPSEVEFLAGSVAGWQPPEKKDMRLDLANMARSQFAQTGKLQLPLGSITVTFQLNEEDAGSNQDMYQRRSQRLKSSGTGKKGECIPGSGQPIGKARGNWFGLVFCSN